MKPSTHIIGAICIGAGILLIMLLAIEVAAAHDGAPRDVDKAIHRHFGKADAPGAFAVAKCESHYNIRALSPGGKYRGLWQFSPRTWRGLGGKGDPAAATAEEQTRLARRLWVSNGRRFGGGPWPVCGAGR